MQLPWLAVPSIPEYRVNHKRIQPKLKFANRNERKSHVSKINPDRQFRAPNPEMRYTPEGNPMTNFSMATSRKFGDRDETTWFRVTVFGRQAEACNQYLRKGSKVLVEGRLYTDGSGNPNVFQRKDGTYGATMKSPLNRTLLIPTQ